MVAGEPVRRRHNISGEDGWRSGLRWGPGSREKWKDF